MSIGFAVVNNKPVLYARNVPGTKMAQLIASGAEFVDKDDARAASLRKAMESDISIRPFNILDEIDALRQAIEEAGSVELKNKLNEILQSKQTKT